MQFLAQLCRACPCLLGDPPFFASTDTNVFYHIEGSRQALKVVFYLDGFHFSRLPSRLEGGASLRLHTVLFTKGEHAGPRGLAGGGAEARPPSTLGPGTYPPVRLPSQLWRMWKGRHPQEARRRKSCSRRSTHSPWRRCSCTIESSGSCRGLGWGWG